MRDGLLRQREPLGNDAAHGVVRHKLVAARLVEGAAPACRSGPPARRRPRQREAALRLWLRLGGFEHLCVFGDARLAGGERMSRLTIRPLRA